MDSIRVVLADDHPIVRTGMHILETARHLFEDVAPDILLIQMNLDRTVDPAADPPHDLASAPQVFVLRGNQNREYIFGLLTPGSAPPLTNHDALALIAKAIHATLDGERDGERDPGVAKVPIHQRQRAPGPTPALTVRELALLRLLTTGQSDQQLGEQLGISKSTVRYHLQNIYKKLGLQQRSAVIAWAVRSGLGDEAA